MEQFSIDVALSEEDRSAEKACLLYHLESFEGIELVSHTPATPWSTGFGV